MWWGWHIAPRPEAPRIWWHERLCDMPECPEGWDGLEFLTSVAKERKESETLAPDTPRAKGR